MPRLPFDAFGLVAPFYDRLHRSVAEDGLRQLLALAPGMALLDLGGGTGRVAHRFQTEAARLVVLDASAGMLARTSRWEALSGVRGVAERLPFVDGAFDRVLCVDALHHFRDHPAALSEVARVLAPGGRMVVEEFNVATLGGRLVRAAEAVLLLGSVFHRAERLVVLLAEAGLRGEVYNSGGLEYFVVAHRDQPTEQVPR